ncbi:PIN domain-containing protein [Candidatus Woesearchaeota archaeon]|nr:PIN domain-containing protein [Candidatus Woesearchaeota archaeon]
MKYVIDAYAWVEYFIESDKGKRVKEIVEYEENEIFTSLITIAEVSSIGTREKRDVELGNKTITNLSNIYGISMEFAKEAGILHAEIRKKIKDFGLADTFVLITARKLDAKIVTGDPHFKGFKDAILI